MVEQHDPELDALRRTVLVANRKGGVGKTSVVTTIASMIARPDRRVLVIDSDSQGNATKSDLGVTGDDGRSFMSALQYGDQLTVVVLNVGTVNQTVTLDTGGFAVADSELFQTRYVPGASETWANLGALPADGTLEIPPRAVLTLVLRS